VEAVRAAGLGGAVGIAVEGDGCFAVARELWQARLVARHALGGVPLDPRAAAASLRPVLRGGFAAGAPGGFGWAEISARSPALRSPPEVVADYARALGVLGLLRRGADGLWRQRSPARGGVRDTCAGGAGPRRPDRSGSARARG
jgi:hypothetical protein